MNRLSQLGLVLAILFLSEILQSYFALPIPATIIGMLLLLILLSFKIVRISWISRISKTLLDNLSIMFVPAGVAIMNELDIFKGHMLAISITIFATTIMVIVVTGYVVQALAEARKGRR